MAQKKIGVAVDNYKLDYVKKKLTKAGFVCSSEVQVTPGVTTIIIHVDEEKYSKSVKDITKITTTAEIHFKRSN